VCGCNADVSSARVRGVGGSVSIGSNMKLSGNLGLRLLGAWLVLDGILPLLGLRIPNGAILLTLLAIVAGVLLILDR
jgi:hypothetical protein